ncbi:hypothetical protein GGR26_001933 [Lewinella marina]|uniref:DUF937 domain-containing protein n=1 Tax=Neolewinella marina TaxID=438751 RepID=A0A2G0CHG0_9BACT|nr:DUF937 domain-containing protein [Neolewinella marina]NJB86165.1 hypothetical protein [Neolewinella marina]PHK99357.1 hypothetical protein CGL56_07860 [Neolewinella marina]
MLESIIDAVKGQVVSTLTQQTGLGAAQAEQAVPLAKESIHEGVTSAISGGNIGGILDMVKSASDGSAGGGLMQNLVYQGIAGKMINKLTSRLGIPEAMAQKVSTIALPMILNKLAGKTREAGDSDGIDQGSLMSVLGLDAGSLLGGLSKGMLGGNKDGDKSGGLAGGLGNLFK